MGSMKIPEETLKWFGGDELRARVFYEKYALRDYEGRVMEKTPPEMWRRVAREISSVEKDEKKRKEWEEKFYWLLENFRFVPGGRIMFGAGNPRKATLLNCYYLPIKEDSIEGIFECAKEMARTYSYGGGVGIDITVLRPRGSPVANSAIFSTGAVSFMDLFSKVTGTIGQSGRRGALMITIEDRHPDVFDFIDVKDDPLRINVRYANISVKVSDELVKAVKEDGLFTLWFENERVKRIEHKVRARDLWSRLVKRAWSCVPYDTEVWIRGKDGKVQLIKIGDLCHLKPNNVEILSLNLKTLKLEWKPITRYWIYKNTKRMVKITTETGKEITLTDDHIVYKLSHGKIENVPAGNIKEGDFLAIAEFTVGDEPKCENKKTVIDLRKYAHKLSFDGYKFEFSGLEKWLSERRDVLGKFPSGKTSRAWEFARMGYIPVRAVVDSGLITEIPSHSILANKIGKTQLKVSVLFEVDEDLAEFLGLYIADGTVKFCNGKPNFIRIAMSSEEFEEIEVKLRKLAQKFNGKMKIEQKYGNYVGVMIASAPLATLIWTIAGHKEGKDIPDEIISGTQNIASAFLRGLFSGDRYVSRNKEISLSSTNRKILEKVRKILLRFGIHSHIRLSSPEGEKIIRGKVCKAKACWQLVIFSHFSRRFAEKIGFLFRKKQEKIEDSESVIYGIPTIANYKLIIKTLGRYPRERVKRGTLKRHPELLKDEFIRKLSSSPVLWEKVAKVEDAKYNKYVYDITVDENHTFVVAEGFVISNSSEPGIILWDTAKRFSPTEYDDKMSVKGVNPCSEQVLEDYGCCFAKGTKILTSHGLENVEDLYERQRYEDVFVATQLNSDGSPADFITFRPAFVFHMGEREVWEVELENGLSIKLTADHEVLVERDGRLMWIQVMDLNENDKVLVQTATPSLRFESSEEDIKLYHLFGWLIGDGWLTEKKTFGITFGPKDDFAREYLTPVWREFVSAEGRGEQVQANGVRVLTSQKKSVKQRLLELGFKEARGPQKRVPECVWKAPDDLQIAFLQGLFSADGTHGNGSHKKIVSLSSSSLGLLKDVQLLLSKFGIQSTLRWTKIRKRGKSQGRLDITRESYVKFMRIIGFPLTPYKNKIKEGGKKYKDLKAVKIKAIRYAGVEDVYDVTEPSTHSLIANGIIVHNCNLGNINLSLFVKNPFGKKPDPERFWDIFEKKGIHAAMEYAEKKGWAYPDLELLEKAVRFGMRFLDDVLDYSADRHPLPEQRDASLYTRRTGLGATGLADMLAKMRIKYDTEEAVYMMDKLFEFIKNTAYDESSEIAKEKGAFPAFQKEKHLDQTFLKGVSEHIREKIWMQGLRNACLLTIPPVGSGAVLAGTTGGIEPIFALSYIRRSESLSKEFFKVYHPLVGAYLELFGGKDENDLPDFFVTAHQIDPKMRVKIQGTIQRHIDSSISSTVNLPKNTTPEEIGMIYELAWEMGCKGITVYREGSREGVLITEEEAKQKLTKEEDGEVPKVEISDVCPECSSTLRKTNSHLVCRGCGLTF